MFVDRLWLFDFCEHILVVFGTGPHQAVYTKYTQMLMMYVVLVGTCTSVCEHILAVFGTGTYMVYVNRSSSGCVYELH